MPEHSLTKQATFLLGGRILAFLISGIGPIVLVRLMDPAKYGQFQQLLFLNGFVVMLLSFQIVESLYYFYPRKKDRQGGLLLQTIAALAAIYALGALGFLGFSHFSDLLPSGLSPVFLLPVAAAFLLEGVARPVDHVFIVEKRPFAVLFNNPFFTVLKLLLVIGAYIWWGGMLAVAWALVIYSGVRLAALLYFVTMKYGGGFRLDRGLLREQFIYVLPLAVSAFLGALGNNIDKLIIGLALPASDFAFYSVGSLGILFLVTFFYTSIGDVTVPRLGELHMAGDLEGISRLWKKMFKANMVVTLPVVIFCFIMAEEIITLLYTDRYLASVGIWKVSLAILLTQMTGYGYVLKAVGDTRSILTGNLLRFLVCIPLTIILVSRYGLMGGAVSFVTGYFINGWYQLLRVKKYLGRGWADFLPWGDILIVLGPTLGGAVILLLVQSVSSSRLVTLIIGGAVYFPLVFALLFYFGVLDRKILEQVRNGVCRR